MKLRLASLIVLHTLIPLTAAHAADVEPEQCKTVKLASPGWSDIDATNALLVQQLKALGYKPTVQMLSVPLTYQGLRSGQIDAFLGNWMPAQKFLVDPLFEQKQIERVATNLERARFTLAVPSYAAEAGIRSFDDLRSKAKDFSNKIYGIEAGAPANENIKRMIADNKYGLGDWKLVESSDSGLLAQLTHELRAKKFMVFLAWEPHIINTRFQITYLTGGEEYFGADAGAATVSTVTRVGYQQQCPNVTRLLSQVKFSVELENEMIRLNVNQKLDYDSAAKKVLAGDPKLLANWLDGVKSHDGGDGLAVVRKSLGI
ncbi:MAG: choline ABC transporter substrate-binding protein [Propionivibrio sp.]